MKASQNFVGKNVSDIFQSDLISVNNQRITSIRPVIGPNGSGKTTLLKFQVRDYLEQLSPSKNLFLFFDFKAVTYDPNQFWYIFVQNLIDQLLNEEEDTYIIRDIIDKIPKAKRKSKLFKIFRNKNLVDNIINLASEDSKDQELAYNYFYSGELDTKSISDFFYGVVKLTFELEYLVAVAFDEIQFLNEIDPDNVMLKIFLEQFIRYFMEQFANERLYITISCLENPNKKEWTDLRQHSVNFATIVQNREIILGNLTNEEKDAIIQQVADKVGFEENDRKVFLTKVKSSLLYFLPRELLGCIANVIDTMDYIGYTDYDIRQIYEEDARSFLKDTLNEKGFIHIEPAVKHIGGYDVDIYAMGETKRAQHVKKALGEVTIMKKAGIKGKVEKFANWLMRMKGREYEPNKGDYAFFVCLPNIITPGAKEVLNDNNIELIEFSSPNVEELLLMREGKGEACISNEKEAKEKSGEIGTGTKEFVGFKKEERYKLRDVPGIAEKKEQLLNKGGIYSIKDLLNCNSKMLAKQIKGLGEASINKWKQAARQILSN